ncbi:MAG: phosphate acyltransferase PlsX [Nitrospirae bacterium]|nr:phosphate acyltransferase PlsX [Nitrospirota bacterium]MBI5694842.1 phosphate acyltransferase PlsX [Nitrospirota bacterium]
MVRIALDAMGGDHAPEVPVSGAVEAARELGVGIVLVGNTGVVERELAKHDASGLDITIRHASQVVEMEESASVVLRKKKDSSIRVATTMVKSGEAVAVVSAGHSGATMATAFFVLGTVKGVERPAIGAFMPTVNGVSLIVDAGANVDCKPMHLMQFAIMGDVFARQVWGLGKPNIGLLSIGEEDTKGNELTREAFKLLKESRLNFIGNIEGRDVFNGRADIIVCDGFIGNVAIKISEGLVEAMNSLLKKEIEEAIGGQLGYLLLRPAFKKFKKKLDYAEFGGAPLLGINGISMICHGHSTPKAIKNGIKLARDFHSKHVNRHIQADIERMLADSSPAMDLVNSGEGVLQ